MLPPGLDVPPGREQARYEVAQGRGHVLLAGLGLDVLGAGLELDGFQAAWERLAAGVDEERDYATPLGVDREGGSDPG